MLKLSALVFHLIGTCSASSTLNATEQRQEQRPLLGAVPASARGNVQAGRASNQGNIGWHVLATVPPVV